MNQSQDPALRSTSRESVSPGQPAIVSRSVALANLADALFVAPDVNAAMRMAGSELCRLSGATLAVMMRGGEPVNLTDTLDAPTLRELARETAAAAAEAGLSGVALFAPLANHGLGRELGIASLAFLPLPYVDRDSGAIVLGFAREPSISVEDRELLSAAAKLVGHALEHARMVERNRAAVQSMAYMEVASRLLDANTDRTFVLHELAKLALPRLGDYAIIDVLGDEGTSVEIGLAHVRPEMEAEVRSYRARYPSRASASGSPIVRAMTTRAPVVVASLSPEQLAEIAGSDEQLLHLRRINPNGFIVAPLLHFGELLGTMSFCLTGTDRQYLEADVTLAIAVADRVSSVLHSMSMVAQSDRARVVTEEANDRLKDQTLELVAANETLQDQAVELEQQTEEAQTLSEELEVTLDELKHSEVRFRALIDASAQAVWRSDASGREWEGSPSWERLTGRRMDVVDAAYANTLHADDVERTDTAWRHAVETATPYVMEHRLRVADGSYRWFMARAVPITDDSGTIVREWVGMHTDIHERHVAADEQRLLLDVGMRTQIESDPDLMVASVLRLLTDYLGASHTRLIEVEVDADVAILHDAHVAFRLDANSRDQTSGVHRYPLSQVTPDYETQRRGEPFVVRDTKNDPRTAASYETIFAPHHTRATISVPLMRGGRWIAALSASSDQPREWAERDSEIVRRVGNSLWPAFEAARAFIEAEKARDEAERRAEESEKLTAALAAKNVELAESEALISGVVGSAMDAIISVNSDGRISVFNAAAERIFGVRAYEAVGEPLRRFLQPSIGGVPSGNSGLLGADMGAKGHPQEVTGYRSDGTVFPGEASISHVAGDAGHFMTVVLRDVTERRALEAQLVQAQKMEAVGRLAGGVAHDFNNILTVIRSCADFLHDSLMEGDARRVDVDEVLAATDRATALTRQLLMFSRKQVVLPRTLDMNMVVRGIEPMLRRLIGEEIELAVMLHGGRLAVRADPGQLEQVIINLAVNARDAMSKGGVLGIETEIVSLSEADIRRYALDPMTAAQPARPGDFALVRVTDTGVGIDPSIMSHVFEPFFTTKAEGHGTGLGLATVLGIAVQAGGHVRVRSVPGDGTTFEVLLPLLRKEDSGEHLPVAPSEHPRASGTILLVEDEVAVRRSVRRMLERAGYTVLEARHGADALLVWRERGGDVDLLLTDLRMPELGGHELIAALHAEDPDLPAIAMSGYPPEMGIGDADSWDGGQRMEFLAKPFTTEVLLSAVERLLHPA